jgi:hypothetical protein
MKKIIVSMLAAIAIANNALATEVAATEVAATEVASVEMTKEEIAANSLASTMAAFAEVCEMRETIVLSKDAIAACDGNEKKMPSTVKNGTRFTKGRTGAEFNTLIANIAAFR